MSMCFGIELLKIVEMNGLVCVEIDRLRHDFNVLTQ